MAKTDIAIGLPFGGRLLHNAWATSFYILDFPLHTQKTLVMVQNQSVDVARNMIVQKSLELEAKYIFFLDDDIICPKFSVLALGSILQTKPDVMVASGIYVTKNQAAEPVIFKEGHPGGYIGWDVNQEFEVDSCGAGCMLVNTEVFKHMEEPYFAFTQKYEKVDNDIQLTGVSEDIYFCNKVREAGFKIYAHGSVLCAHYSNADGKFYELSKDSPPYQRELKRQQKEVEKQTQEV